MPNCDTCAHCTYVHEYGSYICTKNNRLPFYDAVSEPACSDYKKRAETIYNGSPLTPGERIPGTALTFVQSILPRRGEFVCDCGRSKGFSISSIERGDVKSCGCGCHRKEQQNECSIW